MAKLTLSVAVGDYDRTRPLIDGTVAIDGVEPVIMTLTPEEIFFRAFRDAPFDICELSLSSFTVKTAAGGGAYVGVPAFLSRAFRHTSIYVAKDRIARPQDLKGRRIGVAEYQLTANVWARAHLADHGVLPSDVVWVRGGLEEPGRLEKVAVALPPSIRLEAAPEGATLSGMLAEGAIDGVISPRAPSVHDSGHPNVGWLFDDPTAAAKDYYRRTGIFPIMHLVGVRRELAERHPWLPAAVLKAFTAAKTAALRHLGDTAATKATLPFVEEQLHHARALMGPDFWSYGLAPNRHVLDAFLGHHHDQGLSPRLVRADELFHASTHETVKV
jgi:4,5-dihydroxyphthalate decarboxylase